MLLVAVCGAYSNHFHNDFHFDDFHTIVNNISIGRLENIPRFFVDARLFSNKPEGRTWRPIVSTTLAIDYWIARGLKPFYFHLSTFCWYGVQLVLMFLLFRRIMDSARPDSSNLWTAAVAAACYGLHPANAETVNYIIQRGDLYDTLAVVASLYCFIAWPAQRKYGWYLIPAVLGFLSKAPALIYPLILAAYVWLFETGWQAEAPVPLSRCWRALRAVLPAFVVTIAFAILTAKMTPATYDPGADDALLYRVTQPWVAAHYFKWFFLPAELTADRGWDYVAGPWSAAAAAGYMFVIALLAVTVAAARRRVTRPIAFGILWFLFALLPTSLMPLADVTNDHRMFFPFVGLTLAVFWALRLVLSQRTLAIAMAPVLIVALFGTRERNRVWRTDESFWRDVTVKSPSNGRGLTNYALTLIDSHKYTEALIYLQRAKIVRPDYPNVEVSMAAALSALGRDAEAEQHYRRGIELAEDEQPYIEYAAWLKKKGRVAEAEGQLKMALEKNRFSFAARDLLARMDCERGNADAGRRVMTEALPVATGRSADTVLGSATEYCKDADYDRCMLAARRALELRPGWADAYQLIATAYLSMERWDDGVRAALEALRVKPGYSAAKEDLRWGLAHRQS